jgi:hypothetical protein
MKKIKQIAEEIILLEQECQQGINISENLQKMEELMENLPLKDILKLNEIIEKNFLTK